MLATPYQLAERFVGLREVVGEVNNPQVLAMLRLDQGWPTADEVPWCSAFVNYVAWLLRLPRSKSLLARSWLTVGQAVPLEQASVGFDVAILYRGAPPQPGPEDTGAPGHVGFYSGHHDDTISLLGGNQGDAVCVAPYPAARLLGVRRLI